ncbi:hypothetical protein M3Y99_00621700 [Aphelenchoides fujianensis]|nr:hypothetical protein M3Y99_00621700 [Aphelenchoides fujianensis]
MYVLFGNFLVAEGGLKYILIALLPTLVLVFWPRNACTTDPAEMDDGNLPIDYVAIPRIVLAFILVALSIVCCFHSIRNFFFFESYVRPMNKIE